MNILYEKKHSRADLRYKAEKIVLNKQKLIMEEIYNLSIEEIRLKLQDLLVHEIELEMQNEELRIAQEKLNKAQEIYFDLYDLAPVGYCILSSKDEILDTNLMAFSLLGLSKKDLGKRISFYKFIYKEDQDIFYLKQKKLFETHEVQSFVVRVIKNNAQPENKMWANITLSKYDKRGSEPQLRIIIQDITKLMKESLLCCISDPRCNKDLVLK